MVGPKYHQPVPPVPAHFKEDQYLVNTDYIISDKHRLEQRYFHATDPQYQPFSTCSCTPGSGLNLNFSNDVATLRLTSTLTPTFVNEATVSYVRSTGYLVSDATITDQSLGITPAAICRSPRCRLGRVHLRLYPSFLRA